MAHVCMNLGSSTRLLSLHLAFVVGLCLFLFPNQATGQGVKKEVTDKGGKRDILVGSDLSEPFDMGVNSSGGKTDWLSKEPDHMKMAFPANQQWAAVFITAGQPSDPPRPSIDFSSFKTLSIEMRGAVGGERVEIGIKSNDQPDNGRETRRTRVLTPTWEVYEFALDEFTRADLKNLYVVAEFVYNGRTQQTVYFKNVKFLKPGSQAVAETVKSDVTDHGVKKDVTVQEGKRDILVGSNLSKPFAIGADSSNRKLKSLTKEPDHMKMMFPANQQGAGVYITVGEPADPPHPCINFSDFRTLSIEMKGAVGGEKLEVGIRSNDQPDDGKETKKTVTLTPVWKTYEFALSEFTRADLKNLFIVTEFVYNGKVAETVYFKNIKYLKSPIQATGQPAKSDVTGQGAKKDVPAQGSKRDVLIGSDLSEPFDMGVNSSGGKTDWLSKEPDHMKMAFPANQQWAAVFITVEQPSDPPRPSIDLSSFRTLSMEMRGAVGGERIEIGIKANDQPDNGRETKKPRVLTPAWEVYEFPLDEFTRADLRNLYVVAEFVYNGKTQQTVYFKNVKYLR